MNWNAVRERLPLPDDDGSDGASEAADDGGNAGNGGNGRGGTRVTRRRALTALGTTVGFAGSAKAIDNVFVGYGIVEGTNLVDQDLATVVGQRLQPRNTWTRVRDNDLVVHDGVAFLEGDGVDESLDLATATRADAREIDDELGVELFEPLVADHETLARMRDTNAAEVDGVRFEFSTYEPFFERVREGNARPGSVARLRENRYTDVDPATVEAFAEADPRDPKAVVDGLVPAFRGHTSYDIPRYAAGSVEDNVLLGSVDLRQHFESPTDFAALEDGRNSGMFCYEFVYRSVEALHSVSAYDQTTPVFGGRVYDERHKHEFTAIGSVLRESDELVIPMTFVDYTHSTLYDDLMLRGVMGRGLEAYNDRHRATDIFWNN
ncbi:hypothetical protein [Haloarchaeobius litoreus]|uniref:Uncharacterized protein n=1 Tax=Haloarchaeobius litoreus TaxID=755306 RepID=A0ABD6DIV9_9EURY|nr:hypothetical protein [Haloarchaeobius litoreus]